MEDDFYLLLLETATKVGIFGCVPIGDKIRSLIESDINKIVIDSAHGTIRETVERFLKLLAKEDLLTYVNNTTDVRFKPTKEVLDLISANVTITHKGLLFVYKKRALESQTIANKLTFWFIVVTFLVGLLNFGANIKLIYMQNNKSQHTVLPLQIPIPKTQLAPIPKKQLKTN